MAFGLKIPGFLSADLIRDLEKQLKNKTEGNKMSSFHNLLDQYTTIFEPSVSDKLDSLTKWLNELKDNPEYYREYFKKMKKEKNISSYKLSQISLISHASICRYENGKLNLRHVSVKLLLEILEQL